MIFMSLKTDFRPTAYRRPWSPSRPASAGFTLPEMMIGATIGSFVLLGILSSFLFLGRTGANAYNYVGMEQEARRGLERFSEDVRMASGITKIAACRHGTTMAAVRE